MWLSQGYPSVYDINTTKTPGFDVFLIRFDQLVPMKADPFGIMVSRHDEIEARGI